MSPTDSPPFIVDSHVHLWDADALDKLSWLQPGHELYRPAAVADYIKAVNNQADDVDASAEPATGPRVGYIFVEADRKTDADGDDWTGALAEVAYARTVVEAEAAAATSETSSQARCLAIVPWAPVHKGPAVLATYLEAVEATAGPVVWPRVRGFRYLVQDKPHGTMLTDAFVDSLRLLGTRGFTFDLGIDQHRRGRAQMAETVSLVERVHTPATPDAEKVVLVINHMAKPDLSVLTPHADRGFASWRDTMFTLAKASPEHIFIKVSGLFSEMPPALRDQGHAEFFQASFAWLAVLLATFGAPRLMFGSDWPVCTVPYANKIESAEAVTPRTADEVGAWDKWRRIVAYLGYMATLSDDDEAMLWGGTAVKAYGLEKK